MSIAFLTGLIVRPFALAAAAWLMLRLFRVRHPASRHAVWTTVLIGMLLLPALSALTPQWRLPILPANRAAATARVTTHDGAASRAVRPSAPQPLNPGRILLCAYLAGLFAMLSYRAVGWIMLRRMLATSMPLRARLRESSEIVSPIAVGVLRPAVILPADWRTWEPLTRRAVLSHEFAHLRRRDTMVAALSRLAQCAFWFHPLTWWLSRQIAELAELACDAAALERVTDPATYARILLSFAGGRAPSSVLAMAAHPDLSRRIDRIFELSDGISGGTLRKLARPGLTLALLGIPAVCLAAVGIGESQPTRRDIFAWVHQFSPPHGHPASLLALTHPQLFLNGKLLRGSGGVIAGRGSAIIVDIPRVGHFFIGREPDSAGRLVDAGASRGNVVEFESAGSQIRIECSETIAPGGDGPLYVGTRRDTTVSEVGLAFVGWQ